MEEQCIPVAELNIERRRRPANYWKGLLFGGLVGVGIAMLATPRSGEETRDMLREKGIELREKALSKAEEARLRAEELARLGAERVEEVKERSQTFIDTQKINLLSAVDGVREGVKTYRENPSLDMEEMLSEADPLLPDPNTGPVEPRF